MIVVYRLGAMTAWVLQAPESGQIEVFLRNQIYLQIGASSASIFRSRSSRRSIGAELLAWLDDARTAR